MVLRSCPWQAQHSKQEHQRAHKLDVKGARQEIDANHDP